MSIFLSEDVKQLLYNKFVIIIGDSVHRGVYKDLIALLQGNHFLSKQDLKRKGEGSFMNDILIEGGTKGIMNNGINYREVREYKTDTHLVRFYFVTRVHNTYWRDVIFRDISDDPKPDVIIMNSCLWDISRYGPVGMSLYKENLEKTFQTLQQIVPEDCICIWDTALPVASKIRGGFLLPELTTLNDTLRLDVLEGNFYASQLAAKFDIQVLDLNFFFRSLAAMQVGDGVHWNFKAHRRLTNTILTYLAMIWNVKLPYTQGVVPNLLSQNAATENGQIKPQPSLNPSKPTAGPSRSKTTSAPGKDRMPNRQVPQRPPAQTSKLYYYNVSELPQARGPSPVPNNPYSQTYNNCNPYVYGQSQQLPLTNPYTYRRPDPSWGFPNQPAYHPRYPLFQQPWSRDFSRQQYNPYHWFPDSNARRQQRMMAERQQEIVGAVVNAALNQFRVQ